MKRIFNGATEAGASTNLFQMMCRRWHWHRAQFSHSYHPERHYMRGPGPKSRAKRDVAAETLS